MSILITGASGFIGTKLCKALAAQGEQVRALCRDTRQSFALNHRNITIVPGDITNPESLARAMKDCSAVYHMAALAKLWTKDQQDFHLVNVDGTRNVLEAAVTAGVQKVVHTSSCGVIGPTHRFAMSEEDPRITGYAIHYERTKFLAELVVGEYVRKGLDVVIVSPSRVYGDGPVTDSNTVGKMVIAYLKRRWFFIPGDGTQAANYAFADDVVNGHIAAMKRGKSGSKYILGGEDVDFNTFFKQLAEVSGIRQKMYHLPVNLIKLYSQLEQLKARVTGLPPLILPEIADRLHYDQRYSSAKAAKDLDYRMTPFTTGLEKTVAWFQQSQELN